MSERGWIVFLPLALGFGAVSDRTGVHTAGWMLVAVTALTGVALVKVASIHQPHPARCVPGPVAVVDPALAGTCG